MGRNHRKKSAPDAERKSVPEPEESSKTRVSGYTSDVERDTLETELERVAEVEGLPKAPMGLLLSRAARFHLRFDLVSLSRYEKTHPKDARETKPARS